MMMKHSRWSGRRVLPSGGGWMTPNPSGGVAACLVWTGRQISAAAASSTDNEVVQEREQAQPRLQMPPANYRDLNV